MILNRQRAVRVGLRSLETFLRRVRRELRLGETQVTVCLVSDAEITEMNESFRNKRGPTDVLSFPVVNVPQPRILRGARARASAGRRGQLLGDIAIAPAVAKRNARSYGRTLPAELNILMLHGVLHLLGYDHETDRGEMERAEKRLRRRLGLA